MNPEKARSSNRLEALTRIVREVDSAADLDSALRVIVHRTREVMEADVCTIYFTDHDQRHHVVAATVGLPAGLVGQVKAGFGQGLVGQVADSSHPVNLAEVPEELDQEFLTQSGAGRYHGFLGVPVMHKRRVQVGRAGTPARPPGTRSPLAVAGIAGCRDHADSPAATMKRTS